MNGHFMQSYTAIEEERVLFDAGYNLVSTQSGKACNGNVQDTLNGLYILTNTWSDTRAMIKIKTSTLDWITQRMDIPLATLHDMMRRASYYYPKYISISDQGTPQFTKEQVPASVMVSLLFPPSLNFKIKTETNPEKPIVDIRHGILMPKSGPLCKKLIGPGGSLLHWIWHFHSCHEAMKFTSMAEHMVYHWLANHGLSIGPSDCMLTDYAPVEKELARVHAQYSMIMAETHASTSEKEAAIDRVLNSVISKSGVDIVKQYAHKKDRNTFNICQKSGAKGQAINLIQTTCFLGPQEINRGRVPLNCSRQRRTLPCYPFHETSAASRGFIDRNYIQGLSPTQAFFHAMAGRKGLISTAIKTSDTGYIQKCMARKMEDLVVQLDTTVRDANGCIVDFFYGGDGMDPRRIVKTTYGLMAGDVHRVAASLNEACTQWSVSKQTLRRKCGGRDPAVRGRHTLVSLSSDEIDMSLSILKPCQPGTHTPSADHATKKLHDQLRRAFSEVKICQHQKAKLVATMKELIEAAMIAYGTNVGLIASSSLGSPVMQLTLNSFRLAGVKGRDASSGVPRLKELLNVTKTKGQKKLLWMIYPNTSIQEDIQSKYKTETTMRDARLYAIQQLQPLRFSLQYTTMKDILQKMELVKTSASVQSSHIGLVQYDVYQPPWWISLAETLCPADQRIASFSETWVLALTFNPSAMYGRITLHQVGEILKQHAQGLYQTWVSPECMGQIHLVMNDELLRTYHESVPKHVSHIIQPEMMSYHFAKYTLQPYLESLCVAGLPDVQRVAPIEDPLTHEWYLDLTYDSMTDKKSTQRYMKLLADSRIDPTRTYADDIHTVTGVLGIEAGQEYFIRETARVLGSDADSRHIELLAKSMTLTGKFTAASRHGLHQEHQPFNQILFETHVEKATEAAFNNEYDPCTGYAVSVMLGKPVQRIGTGAVQAQPMAS